MSEVLIRFCFGGLLVCAFALLADLFKPKTFAGLFGAAPSVALASLIVTVSTKGKATAVHEAQAMILGSVALLAYAWSVGVALVRWRLPAAAISLGLLLEWLAVAVALWWVIL